MQVSLMNQDIRSFIFVFYLKKVYKKNILYLTKEISLYLPVTWKNSYIKNMFIRGDFAIFLFYLILARHRRINNVYKCVHGNCCANVSFKGILWKKVDFFLVNVIINYNFEWVLNAEMLTSK